MTRAWKPLKAVAVGSLSLTLTTRAASLGHRNCTNPKPRLLLSVTASCSSVPLTLLRDVTFTVGMCTCSKQRAQREYV